MIFKVYVKLCCMLWNVLILTSVITIRYFIDNRYMYTTI